MYVRVGCTEEATGGERRKKEVVECSVREMRVVIVSV